MAFVETPLFTKRIAELLPDESYHELQVALTLRPETGVLIPGGGGLRKVRWHVPGRGKRGGLRVIYYWVTADETIYMLLVCAKSKQDDLTPAQVRALRNVVEEWLP
jgi:hypothetical protein